MLLTVYEIFSILMLTLAGITGILALRSLRDNQVSYKLSRLFVKGIPYYQNVDLRRFIMCAVLSFSTVGCFLSAFLRFTWLNDHSWSTVEQEWAYWLLLSHAIEGFSFTGVHLLVYMRQKRTAST